MAAATFAIGIFGKHLSLALLGGSVGLLGRLVIERSFELMTPKSGSAGVFTKVANWATSGAVRPKSDLKMGNVVIFYRVLSRLS